MATGARMFSVEVTAHSGADAAVLFGLLADAERWPDWARPLIRHGSWERQGEPPPGGVGAIRRVGQWPLVVREEILGYEHDKLLVYTIVSAAPLRDYRAEVAFTARDGGDGTDVAWRAGFSPRVPGTGRLAVLVLRGLFRYLVGRLVKAAGRRQDVTT